jgi:dUTP pyrophosphatase
MKVRIKKLCPEAIIPRYAKPGDAGLDLTATSYEYKNGRHVYGTGLSVEIPDGYVGLIFPRSSIMKQDLRLTNSVGVIDSGYRGEIKFQFENDAMEKRAKCEIDNSNDPAALTSQHQIYRVGERVGQLIILPYPEIEFEEASDLTSSERGSGGFGSTGC